MSDTVIDLLRHGEPVGGRAYRGYNIDDPLSAKGWQQMRTAVGELSPWQHIVSSPLQRCQAFAAELASKYSLPLLIDERFKEVGFGSWEGLTPDELKRDRGEEYAAFYADPVNARPPGAEPLDQFIQRVTTAYQELVTSYAGQHLLLVAHAGVNRCIIAHTLFSQPLGLYRIKVNNAGMTRIKHDQHGGHLLYHNCKLAEMK